MDEIQRPGHHLNFTGLPKLDRKTFFIAVAKVPSYSLVDKRNAWPVTTHIPRTFQLLTRQSVLMWSYFKCNSNWQLSHKNSLRLCDTERSTLWLLSCKFGIFLTPAISPTLHKKYYRIILTNLPKVETMQNTNTQQLTGGDLPMANTSNTSGMSLSRSILLQHFLSNGWYQLYISWDLLKVGRFPSVSRHLSSSLSLSLPHSSSRPWRVKACDSTVGWLEPRLGQSAGAYLPRGVPANQAPYGPVAGCCSSQTVPRMSLNSVTSNFAICSWQLEHPSLAAKPHTQILREHR